MNTHNAAIGDLVYLSGNEMGKTKRKNKKREEKKQSRKTKRKDRPKGTIRKRVAKIGLAPSRAAFLALVDLNVLKLATKLARAWNKPTGKEKIKSFWAKFKGDEDKLKNAIAKGSKQQIAYVGIATEVIIATSLPIIVALIPLIKSLGANGDKTEADALDAGVKDGYNTLETNPDFNKGSADMKPDEKIAPNTDEPTAISTPLLIGGAVAAAAVIYVVTKKK